MWAVILKTIFYWLGIPWAVVALFDVFTTAPFHFIWAIALGLIGIFWSLLSSVYLLLSGNGLPFFGRKSPKILVTCGPYSTSRHPAYFGYIVYTLGFYLLFNPLAIVGWVAEIFSILLLIFVEERSLAKKFPEYAGYKKKKSSLIPLRKWETDRVKDPPFLFAILYIVGKFIIRFFYDVKVYGKAHIPTPPYVMISNHNCYFDPFYIMDAMNVYMKAPLSWAHYERMKWLIDNVGMFPIKRYTTDSTAVLKMVRTLRKKGVVGIFVENERSWDGRPLNVKNGIDRLLETLRMPILPVRIERAHLMWPRWGSHFHKGRVNVVIGKLVDAKDYSKAIDFVLKDTITINSVYKDYRGIESYLWKCPECGTVGGIESSKSGFGCSHCHRKWHFPTVEEVRIMHDSIFPSHFEELPIFDEAIVDGIESTITLTKEQIKIGQNTLPLFSVKATLMESRHDFYIYTGKLFEIRPLSTSPLMWKEWMDFLKKGDTNYWRYR